MGVVALGSLRSAAVTTTALAVARTWPTERDVLLAEFDPSGGTLAATIGLHPEPGLQSLAAAARRGLGADALVDHAQALSEHAAVLLSPPVAEQVRAALSMVGNLPLLVCSAKTDVLCDCGRLDPASPVTGIFHAADLALVVVRGELADLHVLAASLERRGIDATAADDRLGLVLVGGGPYGATEVEEAIGIPVLAVLPHDPSGARALGDALPRAFALRSPLPRAARSFAAALVERFGEASDHVDCTLHPSEAPPTTEAEHAMEGAP